MCIRDPKTTALIFTSKRELGNTVVTHAKSEDEESLQDLYYHILRMELLESDITLLNEKYLCLRKSI